MSMLLHATDEVMNIHRPPIVDYNSATRTDILPNAMQHMSYWTGALVHLEDVPPADLPDVRKDFFREHYNAD
jgi:hypothetical protein